jgi:competence protein ComEC
MMHRAASINGLELPHSFSVAGKTVLRIDRSLGFKPAVTRPSIDLLILSQNPKLYMNRLLQSFSVKQVVIDGSVPQWKAKLWQKDCDSLGVSCYNVREKGAFVMNF